MGVVVLYVGVSGSRVSPTPTVTFDLSMFCPVPVVGLGVTVTPIWSEHWHHHGMVYR